MDKTLYNIKEKRTFVMTQNCECGGEFRYSPENICSDLFGSFFATKDVNTSYEYEHKCTKCGTVKKFKNVYPLEREFMIGLSASTEDISQFVAETFDEVCKDGM